MVKRNVDTEAKKAYCKPELTRNEPLVNITFASPATAVAVATTIVGYGGSPATLVNTPNIGVDGGAGSGPGGGATIIGGGNGGLGSGGGGLDGGIGGGTGGATLIGGGTLITGTGGAPGTVL